MKRSVVLLAAAAVTAFLTTPAFADLLIYEPFDYSPGSPIIGQTDPYSFGNQTWARAGTASTANVHHVGTASLPGPSGYPATLGYDGVMIGGPVATGDFTEYGRMSLGSQYGANATLYYSLLLNVPSTTGLTVAHSNVNANNDGIIAFNNNTGGGSRPNTWAGELVIRLGGAANTFNLGIRASTTAAGTTYFTGDLNPGQTYFVVGSFTEGATPGTGGSSSIWLDPSSATFGGTAPAADGITLGTYSTSATVDHTDSIIIGAGIAAGAAPSETHIDEIKVGDTWASVTTVPEPSTLVLAGLGTLALVSWHRARRR
jgi:hypothetical protein